MYDHIGLRGGMGIGEWGISNQSHQQHPPAPKEVISGAHPIKTSRASKASKARGHPGLAPRNRFQPVLPSTLGSCGFPLGTNHLEPQGSRPGAGPSGWAPIFMGPADSSPRTSALGLATRQPWTPFLKAFLCPTQDRLVCNRSCSMLLHHGPVLSVAPCKTGAVAVSWAETRGIDHQEESWTS